MKKFFSKILVSLITFLLGVLLTAFFLVSEKIEEKTPVQPEIIITQATKETEKIIPTFASTYDEKKISPYDIKVFINNNPQNYVEEIWELLKINKVHFGNSINNQENNFFKNCSNCEAETFDVELDGQSGSELLLRIEDRSSENCRYLLFKYLANTEWQLLGYIDHDFGRYEMPRHSNLISDGKDWLVVRVQVGSGSGFALYYDRLFAVVNNKLVEILEFPADGHESGVGTPSREFTAYITNCKVEKNSVLVEVEFDVTYSIYTDNSDNFELWSKKEKAVFRKNLKNSRLIFDTEKSTLSRREMESAHGFNDSLTNEDLVKYNFEELKKISLRKNSIKKEWLQRFLEMCDPTRQTKILKNNLKK